MRKLPSPLTILIACFLLKSTEAAIEGNVTDPSGAPVLRAWVYLADERQGTYTDANGYFIFADVEPPTTLVVFHKNFELQAVEVQSEISQPIQIGLALRQGLSQEITVTARNLNTVISPTGLATGRIEANEVRFPTSRVLDMIETVPGIAQNGQGGHLNVFSIRGVSRHRVRTSVGGVRLAGERRAGVSASFLDPFLMGSIELTRGPSSGALGGAVEILPRTFEGLDLGLGYTSQGNENSIFAGWGKDEWSVGFARRSASDSTAADGTKLNTHFTQYSGLFSRLWESADREYRFFLIPALGNDIGKSNVDFPERTTRYPRERHLLVSFATQNTSLWKIEAFFHPHDLQTQILESSGERQVFTNSIDFGAGTEKQILFGSRYILNLSADYFGRRGVDSEERKTGDPTLYSLEDGVEDEIGLNTSLGVQLRRVVLEGGARFSWIDQTNQQQTNVSDSAFSGFAGVSVPLGSVVEMTGSVGSGLRFPTLSERFFQGSTGRGAVVGNPLLDTERSISSELGIEIDSARFFATGHYFLNRISDYVERVDLNDGLYTFVNLTRGTIHGFEWETALLPQERSSFYFRGHLLSGEDDQGAALSDIPVHRFTVGFRREQTRAISIGAEWQFRGDKDNPGSGEKKILSANLLSAYLGFKPVPSLHTSLAFRNLLNELYFPTADRKAALAAGRSVSVSLTWMPD